MDSATHGTSVVQLDFALSSSFADLRFVSSHPGTVLRSAFCVNWGDFAQGWRGLDPVKVNVFGDDILVRFRVFKNPPRLAEHYIVPNVIYDRTVRSYVQRVPSRMRSSTLTTLSGTVNKVRMGHSVSAL
jgi:hypothetical protein